MTSLVDSKLWSADEDSLLQSLVATTTTASFSWSDIAEKISIKCNTTRTQSAARNRAKRLQDNEEKERRRIDPPASAALFRQTMDKKKLPHERRNRVNARGGAEDGTPSFQSTPQYTSDTSLESDDFECVGDATNQFHYLTAYSPRSNALSIPTFFQDVFYTSTVSATASEISSTRDEICSSPTKHASEALCWMKRSSSAQKPVYRLSNRSVMSNRVPVLRNRSISSDQDDMTPTKRSKLNQNSSPLQDDSFVKPLEFLATLAPSPPSMRYLKDGKPTKVSTV